MGGRTIKCIWHCFLVDKGSDQYASPDTGRAEGECLYRRQVPIWAFIDQKAVPYTYLLIPYFRPQCAKIISKQNSTIWISPIKKYMDGYIRANVWIRQILSCLTWLQIEYIHVLSYELLEIWQDFKTTLVYLATHGATLWLIHHKIRYRKIMIYNIQLCTYINQSIR